MINCWWELIYKIIATKFIAKKFTELDKQVQNQRENHFNKIRYLKIRGVGFVKLIFLDVGVQMLKKIKFFQLLNICIPHS